MRTDQLLLLVLRQFLSLVFLVSGLAKAGNPDQTVRSVEAYKLLPSAVAAILARILPWLELALGVCLLFGPLSAIIATVVSVLLVVFVFAQATVLVRGLKGVGCGCFGPSRDGEDEVSLRTLARTALFFFLSAFLAWRALEGGVDHFRSLLPPSEMARRYGFFLGFGLSTRVSRATLYVALVGCLFLADVSFGALAMSAYGLMRALMVLGVIFYCRSLADFHKVACSLSSYCFEVKWANGVALTAFVVHLVLHATGS